MKKFALIYVNDYTYEMPEAVVKAHDELYQMVARKGFFREAALRHPFSLVVYIANLKKPRE